MSSQPGARFDSAWFSHLVIQLHLELIVCELALKCCGFNRPTIHWLSIQDRRSETRYGASHIGLINREDSMCCPRLIENYNLLILSALLQDAICSGKSHSYCHKRYANTN